MLKLMIADGTEGFRTALTEEVRDSYTVRSCADGEEATELLRTFLPDILVVDLTLPGVDGLSLIQLAKQIRSNMMILATTRFVSDYVLEALGQIGVDYMMIKPCNPEAVACRLADLEAFTFPQRVFQPDLYVMTANLLLLLGISTNRKGYAYLREAIFEFCNDPHQSMTKELYPSVARAFDADAVQVERAIRSAIEKAWRNREESTWSRYFLPGTGRDPHKPTNSEFISRLADILTMDSSCVQAKAVSM